MYNLEHVGIDVGLEVDQQLNFDVVQTRRRNSVSYFSTAVTAIMVRNVHGDWEHHHLGNAQGQLAGANDTGNIGTSNIPHWQHSPTFPHATQRDAADVRMFLNLALTTCPVN